MKTIIVGVDFAPDSARVVEAGLSLATALRAQIVFLHVINRSTPAFDYGFCDTSVSLSEKEAEDIKHRMEELSVEAERAGLRAIVEVRDGFESYVILQRAKFYKADLLVMGQHSHRVFHELFGASVAQAVCRACEFPVLLVPLGNEGDAAEAAHQTEQAYV